MSNLKQQPQKLVRQQSQQPHQPPQHLPQKQPLQKHHSLKEDNSMKQSPQRQPHVLPSRQQQQLTSKQQPQLTHLIKQQQHQNLQQQQLSNIQGLVQERLYPLVQQVVGFLGIEIPVDESSTGAHESVSTASSSTTPSATTSSIAAMATATTTTSTNTSKVQDSTAISPIAQDPSPSLQAEDGESSGGDENLGILSFSVSYSSSNATLTLKILKANDLVAKDLSGTSDPYVKVMLLPDKKRKLTTKIKRKNLNPRWNETFAFEGFPYMKLVSRTLYLQVLDYDRFSRDDPIGEIHLSLADLDLSKNHTFSRSLLPCKSHVGKLGELEVSLNYEGSVGVISVGIMRAKNLKAKDINGLSDPYVKIWMMHDGKKIEKKKTEIIEKNLNPVFDETFMFTVPYERIRQTSMVISVMDYDRMGRNEPIGQLILGNKSGSVEVKHWNEMFAKTRTNVVKWHLLKDFS